MATIAIPHYGAVSHFAYAMRIGELLARHGHRVLAWAPEEFRGPVVAAGAEFFLDPFSGERNLWAYPAKAAGLAEHALAVAPELIQRWHDERVDLVVHDVNVLWGRVAAEFLGLPRIVSNPVFPGAELPASLRDQPAVGHLDEAGGDALVRQAVARFDAARSQIAAQWGIDIGDWREALVGPAEVSVRPTTEAITAVALPGGSEYIGAMLGPGTNEPTDRDPSNREPTDRIGARPFVFASLGTVFNADAARFDPILAALAAARVDAVLSAGGGPLAAGRLTASRDNVRIVSYVEDQPRMLAGADAFISHAGTASVHEALLAGTPLVCLPQSGDQFEWARRVAELGAGVVVEPRAEAIEAGLVQVLGDPAYRDRARWLGHELSAYPGESRLLAAVAGALARAGTIGVA